MTTAQLLHLRLRNLQITATTFTAPQEIVSWLGAMQAQDYLGTKWALALRLPGTTDVAIEKAINEGSIIRSWPMRGTLHFVAPEDIRWMLALMTPRIIAKSAGHYRQLGLDEMTLKKGCNLLKQVLHGGKQLTRAELMQHFLEHDIATHDQRGYMILVYAAMNGVICVGPMRGKQQTFVLLDNWVPKTPAISRDKALAQIARRYFTGHGPATLKDFAWWTGLTLTDARAGLAMVQNDVVSDTIDDQTFWMTRELAASAVPNEQLFLLPGFDEYMLGYTDRTPMIGANSNYMPPLNGVFPATIVLDGKIVGIWRRTLKAKEVIVTPTLFSPLSKQQQSALHEAAERYARYVQLPLHIAE